MLAGQAKGGHTQAFATEPREYERRVIEFLGESLGVHAAPAPLRARDHAIDTHVQD